MSRDVRERSYAVVLSGNDHHYRTQTGHANIGGTWYGEYVGIFPTRIFVVAGSTAKVAPFDVAFAPEAAPSAAPDLPGIEGIAPAEFEAAWETYAQARLHALAFEGASPDVTRQALFFANPFPARFKGRDEGDSTCYYEYSDGISRRFFEVWANGDVVVSPFDTGPPEGADVELLAAARTGMTRGGQAIEPGLRPYLITHAEFEKVWEQVALPRLRVALGL